MSDYTLHLGDCLEYMRMLPDGFVDAVITDPPYGILPANWDKVPDVKQCIVEIKRILSPTGFWAFFGQMSSILDWINLSHSEFHFYDHVVWVKRNTIPGGNAYRLSRSHESIMIYAARSGNRAHQIKGPFEDVKIPGLLFDVATVEGIARAFADLRLWVKRGEPRTRQFDPKSGTPEFHRVRKLTTFDVDVNFTNVWSFLPAALKKKGEKRHPAEKPVEVKMRLCEMLAPENGIVLDPFMGSGTTGVACVQTGRRFIGCEIEERFFDIARARIEHARPRIDLPLLALTETTP